jgi:hypothetical protein
MFSKIIFAVFFSNALLTQGSQLRGSSTHPRNLDVSSICIPVGEAPFIQTAFVAVDLNGTRAFNASTFDLFNIAAAFEVTYDFQVYCGAIAGSRREVGRIYALTEAVGPDGVASELLQVEIFCNACGDGDDIELFRDSPTTLEDTIEDVADVACACDGPFIPSFIQSFNAVFALTTTSGIVISDVHQLIGLDCGYQNFTSFNASGVCLGPDALAFKASEEFPSAAPSSFPSEYPSEFPSEFP